MNAKQQAEANIRATLGLSPDASEWTYDQRVAYNRAVATWIAANPDSVSLTDLSNAQANLNGNYPALADTSFLSEGSDFFGYLEDEAIDAGNAVGGIGRGVLNLASLSAYIIPLAGIVVVVILLFAFKKKSGA